MSDTTSTDSPLEAATVSVSRHATEAFALLGHETRLAILLAIWDEYDKRAEDNAVAFSRIYEQVDHDDPGNLRYHLEKLEGQFVRQRTDRGGYELRVPARKLVRAVIAGAGAHDERFEPVEIDEPCPFCGASTVMSYREGVLFWACHECDGMSPGRDFASFDPPGPLSALPFDPAGLGKWTARELRAAGMVVRWRELRSMFDGICPNCSGPIDAWFDHCSDHDPDGCEECGLRFETLARFRCRTCEYQIGSTPKSLALFHPSVVSFYDDHGVMTRVRADDFQHAKRVYSLVMDHVVAVVNEDPTRVAVTGSLDDETIRLTFDETVRVADVSR